MDSNVLHPSPYVPARRKPVPSHATYPGGAPNYQQNDARSPANLTPQNCPSWSASRDDSLPSQTQHPGIPTHQRYTQTQNQYTPHSPPHAPVGQQSPGAYTAQQSQRPSTLKSFGSFMKSALKATLDPNNIHGNAMGTQQTVFGQHQVPQPVNSYANGPCPQQMTPGATIVNGQILDAAATSRLQMCGIVPTTGRYWYDTRCGAWGLECGPCIGILPPNLSLGGPLAPNASGPSMTGVFINGRQIHALDALQFQAMGITCIPGRWWVNADGTYGMEGSMIPWGNLRMQAMASQRTNSGYGSWSNGDSFGGSDGQGFSYVGGHDSTGRAWSVSTG